MEGLLYENKVSSKDGLMNSRSGKNMKLIPNTVANESIKKKILEDIGEKAFAYFQSIPFVFNLKILYVSTDKHYFYQPSEFSDVDVMINLRQLNTIPELIFYLKNICQLLPDGGYYIGTFKDFKYELKNKKSYLGSRFFLNLIYRLNNRLVTLFPAIRKLYYFIYNDYLQSHTLKDIKRNMQNSGFSLVDIKYVDDVAYFLVIKMQHISRRKINTRLSRKRDESMIIEL